MPTPQDIHNALTNVTDEASFIQELLVDTLGWPMPEIDSLDDIAFEWTEDELRTSGLSHKLLDGKIKQLQPLTDNQPWGVFLLEFKHDNVFTQSRGMTGPLRKVLRGLVPKRTRDASKPAWKREHLLFICTHKFQHYRFAYFKAPKDGAKTAPLAIFGWSPEEPVRTVCQFNLPQLQWPARPQDTEAWVSQWTAAFDVEKVTKEFFRDYRAAFEEVEGRLKGIRDKDQRRLYTQRLFNRLLFIHFIQKKGWLRYNGSANYLQELFNAATAAKEDFLNDRLYWLFFCGFNQIKTERSAEDAALLRDRCGEVPYLNGGLFAMADETDEQGKVRVPNEAFRILMDIFAHYNFTVSESTPWDIEVAVDPEMLGKVFEELVTGRHESGSYYTPRPIVSFMCKEALKGFLCGVEGVVTNEQACGLLVDSYDPAGISVPQAKALLKHLNTLRAVDPACGSGAYLLGLLHELHAITQALDTRAGEATARDDYDRKLAIIQNNLYGVDLDPFAANIARLRLWLSLAVEFQGKEPEPLPNLDFKIEVGDSVLAANPETRGQLDLIEQIIERFRELKAEHMRASSLDKFEKEKEVRAVRENIADFLAPGQQRSGFDWAIDFAEVFAEGGFNVVLANPPYVRQELIRDIKPKLKLVYGRQYSGTADLYTYFYLRAIQLLRPGGTLVFISSNKWFRANYGKNLREYIASHTDVRSITDFGDLPVFETATAYPMIFIAQKRSTGFQPMTASTATLTEVPSLDPPYPDIKALTALHGHALPQTAIQGGTWTLTTHSTAARLEQMRKNSMPLKEFMEGKIFYGIKTGLSKAFVIDSAQRTKLIREHSKSAELIRPFAVGRDVRRWRIKSQDRWLIFTRQGTNIDDFPAVKNYLAQWKRELTPKKSPSQPGEGRKPGPYKWHEIQDTVAYFEVFSRPKIVYQRFQVKPYFAFDSAGIHVNDAVYVLASQELYLLGVLNSRAFWTEIERCCTRIQNGYQLLTVHMEKCLIPNATAEEKRGVSALVEKCLAANGEGCEAWEREIDERVAGLYGL